MLEGRVLYFRVESSDEKEYFAARSRDLVVRFIEKTEDPGYNLDTLVRVQIGEARKAPYFEEFAKDYTFCSDGTFLLGKIDL